MKNKGSKGISLITLIITIIVVIILATAIILSLANNNVIDKADEARFKATVDSYKSELFLWLSKEYEKTAGQLDVNQVNASKTWGQYNGLKIQDIIQNMSDEHADMFDIVKGELVEKKGYTEGEIDNLIEQGYIPIATAEELNNIRYNANNTFGSGTKWQAEYTGGVDKKYVQVRPVDLSEYRENGGWISIMSADEEAENRTFTGIYDGNYMPINNLYINNNGETATGLFGAAGNNAQFKSVILNDISITQNGDGARAGGLISDINGENIKVENVEVTGSITSKSTAAGLICLVFSSADIKNCNTNVNVTSINSDAAGLIFYNNANVQSCYSTGNVSSKSISAGLVAMNFGGITNSYSTGSINSGYYNIGGLVGQNNGTITDSHSSVNINVTADNIGGLIGLNYGDITKSYSIGNINATGDNIGGLIGYSNGATIDSCYSKVNITGGSNTGGLVGVSADNITNCYVISNINAVGGDNAGGLIGVVLGESEITNCFCVSTISGSTNIGGVIVGTENEETPGASIYWDTSISGISNSGIGYGKTTSEMKTQSTYVDWDFSTVWRINPSKNDGYPYLIELENTL